MLRRRRQPITIEVEPEELARRYWAGASLDDLGVVCQCTGTRVRAILVALGVEIRPCGGHTAATGRKSSCAAEPGDCPWTQAEPLDPDFLPDA